MQADTPKQRWFVEVIEAATDSTHEKVIKTIQCDGQRTAERVERGMNINLNHERFYIRIYSPEKEQIHD